jgi:UDP-N-acetylglucosamine diphosphorylase/glucosamine-1-phosphate N-acetyltransferase
MRICLFEDHRVGDLEPLTLTRPAFDLLCGLTPLAEKQARFFATADVGWLVRPLLADLCRRQNPSTPVNDLQWLHSASTVLVNGRWLPPDGLTPDLSGPCVGLCGDEVAYAVLGPEQLADCSPDSLDDGLATWAAALPRRDAGGRLFRYLWELVQHNGERIERDWRALTVSRPVASVARPAVVGPTERVWVDPSARVDPFVVADTTGGPVVVDREAVVLAFSRLEGPCYVGPRTQVHGAKVRAGTSLGPDCRFGGEVEASVVLGRSNKYHDGFLGHAYVGEWVNLGAGTSNSDLRNDYGEVSVVVNGRLTPTGQAKVGCFLGDHVKAGLGTLLNTGTSVGPFAGLLPGGGLLPRYIPSFASWWNAALADRADLDALFSAAAQVMSRRGQEFTPAHAALYRALFEQTAAERRRAVRDAEARRLRRSA